MAGQRLVPAGMESPGYCWGLSQGHLVLRDKIHPLAEPNRALQNSEFLDQLPFATSPCFSLTSSHKC